MDGQAHGVRRLLSAGAAVTLAIGMLAGGRPVFAAEPARVGLGSAATFAVLAGAPGVTNSGSTVINGDLGISPSGTVKGFPPGTLNGTAYAVDAVAHQAMVDLAAAIGDAAGRTPAVAVANGLLGGTTLVAGIYASGGVTLDLTGTLTLDGRNDPTARWIFQATSDLVTAASSSVVLVNAAQACNVFWQVAGSATLGADSRFAGNVAAGTSITLSSGVTLSGRALARGGVALMNDVISYPACFAPDPPAPPAVPVVVVALAEDPGPATGSTIRSTDAMSPVAHVGFGTTPVVLAGIAFGLGLAGLVIGRRWLGGRPGR